jgi:hypothetical protein
MFILNKEPTTLWQLVLCAAAMMSNHQLIASGKKQKRLYNINE